MRRNRRVTFSHRTTFAHWLIRIGRSRHDCTHLAYIVPMIVSEVGRTTSRSSSVFVAALRHPRDLRREALDVLALLHQQAFRDEQREVRVDVTGRLEPAVERLLHQLPDGVAVRTDHHAALDGRVVGELGAADDVDIPAAEVLGLRRDLGWEIGNVGLSLWLMGSVASSVRLQPDLSAIRLCQCISSRCGKSSRKWPPRLSSRRARRARSAADGHEAGDAAQLAIAGCRCARRRHGCAPRRQLLDERRQAAACDRTRPGITPHHIAHVGRRRDLSPSRRAGVVEPASARRRLAGQR